VRRFFFVGARASPDAPLADVKKFHPVFAAE
jgi:hypothetical protein